MYYLLLNAVFYVNVQNSKYENEPHAIQRFVFLYSHLGSIVYEETDPFYRMKN